MTTYRQKFLAITAMFLISTVVFGSLRGSHQSIDAAAELERLGVSSAVPNLKRLIGDDSAPTQTRYFAAIALGQYGAADSIDILATALEDPILDVRFGAIIGISELQDTRAIPTFRKVLLSDENDGVKYLVIESLRRFDSDEARETLVECFGHPSQSTGVQVSLIESYVQFSDIESAALLQELQSNDDVEIRTRALLGLSSRFGSQHDFELVDIAKDADLPYYLWSDVVTRLEKISGRQFRHENENRGFETSAASKSEILGRVDEWWNSGGRRK